MPNNLESKATIRPIESYEVRVFVPLIDKYVVTVATTCNFKLVRLEHKEKKVPFAKESSSPSPQEKRTAIAEAACEALQEGHIIGEKPSDPGMLLLLSAVGRMK